MDNDACDIFNMSTPIALYMVWHDWKYSWRRGLMLHWTFSRTKEDGGYDWGKAYCKTLTGISVEIFCQLPCYTNAVFVRLPFDVRRVTRFCNKYWKILYQCGNCRSCHCLNNSTTSFDRNTHALPPFWKPFLGFWGRIQRHWRIAPQPCIASTRPDDSLSSFVR